MKSVAISRRSFIRHAGVAGAVLGFPTIIPSSVLGADATVAPSNRIALGFIGTGDHGVGRNLNGFLNQPDAQIVAICDVDARQRERARQFLEKRLAQGTAKLNVRDVAAYNDFREIIARKDIDAVMISTPDHWHVIPAILAAQAGKDVICEKPLTMTVQEGRWLADTMKRHGRIFQTASENRSMRVFIRMCELVRNGRLGKLQRIRVELPTGRSIRPASRKVEEPPKGFDYDFWLGPAPVAPYCEARCHWNFRWIFDYSGGMLTDWGAHLIDIAQLGNNTETTGPIEIEGTGEFAPDDLYNTATKWDIRCTYANGVQLQIVSAKPGIRFEGTSGAVWNSNWGAPVEASDPKLLTEKIGPEEIHLYTAPDEHRNFLDCVKSRRPCYAPAEIGHRTITIAHLGNIAMKLGRKFKWNPDTERFVDAPDADRLLTKSYRAPWDLEKIVRG